jgi:hypothetical protein
MNPSLLIIPDRYKAAKLYSQIPNSGDGDLDFARASVATRVNASGLIESVASGVPRLDYTGGGCPALLLEPQRANLTFWSEDFTNAAYISNQITVTSNFATAPNGEMTADKLVENTANSTHGFSKNTSLGGSVDSSMYAISFYLKANGRSRVQIFDNNQNTSGSSVFDLSTGTVINGTGTISLQQNGFYRCTIYPLKNFSTTSVIVFRLISTGTTTTYTGDGISGVIIWGTQVEAGVYPTSYIPTTTASVTRLADVASKGSISSLVNNTEGTLYFEVLFDKLYDAGGAGPSGLEIGDGGSFANIISIGVVRGAQNAIRATNRSSSSNVFVNAFNVNTVGKYKCAFSYGAAGNSFYVNGSLVSNYTTGSSSTAAVVNSFSRLTLGGVFFGGTAISQNNDGILAAALYPTRLSNSELATLTAL